MNKSESGRLHGDADTTAPKWDESQDADLRQKALDRLRTQGVEGEEFGEDLAAVVEELSIHRLELEVQNDELRSTQGSLQTARDRYAVLYEMAPTAFLALSKEGKILSCNKAAAKLFGMSEQRIVGRRLHDFVAPEAQDDLHFHHRAIVKTAHKQTAQLQLKSTNTEPKVVLLESVLDCRLNPSEFSWFASLTDISDQKRLERELSTLNQELEERAELRAKQYLASRQETFAVLNAVADPIVTIDRLGRIQSLNPATARTFGYIEEELRGADLATLLTESGALIFKSALEDCSSEVVGEAPKVRRELLCRHQKGSSFPVEMALAKVDEDGHFTLVFRDLREKRRLEWEVMQVAEDERSRISRELHDSLGQELAAMSLDAQVIAADIAETNERALSGINGFGKKLQHAIRQLRSIIFDLAPIDVSDGGLVDALEALTRNVPVQDGFRCSFSLSHAESVATLSRETEIQLLRIAQEAVHNARKHSRATELVVCLSGKNGDIELQIIDDGEGVSINKRRDYGGGQGLRIMRYRAGLIGAELKITRFQPHGTKVVCRLPQTPCEGISG